ncbi:MAG: hypothetical protein Q8N55_02305 [bacterium]|nr:hypothetical protein [bacterium]
MLKTSSVLKKALILIAIFVLLFLENTLPLLKGVSFLKNLPFLTIFLFIFFSKSPLAFLGAFLAGAFLDFYSPLPLFSFAFLFLTIALVTKYLQQVFEDNSFGSFFISFALGFLVFRFFSFFLLKSIHSYFSYFFRDFIFSVVLVGLSFLMIKYCKRFLC